MAVGKAVRFRVFHRYRFTCQYCGKTPPDVVLEIDHVIPRAEGGDDDETNLVPACFDCNRGKSAKLLERVPAQIVENAERRREEMEQLREFNRLLLDEREEREGGVSRVSEYWCSHLGEDVILNREPMASIRHFLSLLPEAEVLEAVDIAMSRKPIRDVGEEITWRYFCGICWTKIRNRQGVGNGKA